MGYTYWFSCFSTMLYSAEAYLYMFMNIINFTLSTQFG